MTDPIAKTTIWTDGSCNVRGVAGRGGWAALIERDGEIREMAGHATDTTHNRMELTAVCEGLATQSGSIEVRTDSRYVERCFNDRWYDRWLQGEAWRGANGKIRNQDLWERLFALVDTESRRVEFVWVKGHAGDPNNERVDRLARQAAISGLEEDVVTLESRGRIDSMLELLRAGLAPFARQEFERVYGERWRQSIWSDRAGRRGQQQSDPLSDIHELLNLMTWEWNAVFRGVLSRAARSYTNELIDVRNRWAHQEAFSTEDVDRAVDTARRLLEEVGAAEAKDVAALRDEPSSSSRSRRDERPSQDHPVSPGFDTLLQAAGSDAAELVRSMDDVARELALVVKDTKAGRTYRRADGASAWIVPAQRRIVFDLRTLARRHPDLDVAALASAISRLSTQPSTSDQPGISITDAVTQWTALKRDVVEVFFGTGIG